MKKLFWTFLLGFFVLLQSFAVPSDNANAVSMVSYEQNWIDSRGTLALKNNTSEAIHNVTFLITYLDMSGREMDYEEFFEEVDIEPGKTKKIDIDAYEHDRYYHYYKSENSPTDSPAFKIKFELKEYNSAKSSTDSRYRDPFDTDDTESDKSSGHGEGATILIAVIAGILIVAAIVGLYALVAIMAKKRNRNVVLWVLLSMFASPLLIIIILLAVGEDDRIDELN